MRVDKNIVYEVGEYSFRNFIALSDEERVLVWRWRNDDSMRRFMYNKDIIPFENHIRFLEGLKSREDVYYWLVEKNHRILGVVNLTNVDLQEAKAELGYYVVPELQKKGIGIGLVYHCLLFAFTVIGADTLFGCIDKRNTNAIILDSYLGCGLNSDDLNNLDSVEYIRWETKCKDFLVAKEGKDNFRNFVQYMKDNKPLIDLVRQYAV